MISRFSRCLLGVTAVVGLFISQVAYAQTVTYEPTFDLIDSTDLSGLPVDGWWFANFDTAALQTGQPVAQNAVDNLPGWMQLGNNFDPDPVTSTYSWDQEDVLGTLVNASESIGGHSGFNSLTIPGGTSGLSGQAITNWEAGNDGQSRNLVSNLVLGPGAPSSFRLFVTVDNEDSLVGTGVRRVKARLSGPGVPPDTEDDTGNGIDDTRNNIADTYAFRYDGITDDMVLRIQLRTTNNPIGGNPANIAGAGMAGFMIQTIPEPSGLALLFPALLGLGWLRRRRR